MRGMGQGGFVVYVCGLVGALGKWTLLDLHRWEGEPEGIVRRFRREHWMRRLSYTLV